MKNEAPQPRGGVEMLGGIPREMALTLLEEDVCARL